MTPTLFDGKLQYTQESDSCDPNDLGQAIDISAEEGGGGKFFVIKTERWAFDSIGELVELLDDAAKRLGIKGAK